MKPIGCTLAFGSTNVRSLSPSKLDDLLVEFKDHSLEVMLLCETWHDADSVSIRRLRVDGFSVVERARPRRHNASLKINHGGVAIVAAPKIRLTAVKIGSSPSTFECTAARITSGQSSCLVAVVYRPGSSAVMISNYISLWKLTLIFPTCRKNSTNGQTNGNWEYRILNVISCMLVARVVTRTCKIIQIESVQRRFNKRLPGLKNVKYKERLDHLKLETLEMRRLRLDLIFTYMVIFGLVSGACNELFMMSDPKIPTRGHSFKPYQRYNRVDSRKSFFAERIVHPWNNMPANNEHFKSLATFKIFKIFHKKRKFNQFCFTWFLT